MPDAHDNPHQHVYFYNFKQKEWQRNDAKYFNPSDFFRMIESGYKVINSKAIK